MPDAASWQVGCSAARLGLSLILHRQQLWSVRVATIVCVGCVCQNSRPSFRLPAPHTCEQKAATGWTLTKGNSTALHTSGKLLM